MTHLVKTERFPILGQPSAGALERNGDGLPVVPLTLSATHVLLMDNPMQARDLAIAATTVASVLEAEHGLGAPTEQPSLNDVLDECNTYADILRRAVDASNPSELWPVLRDARLALEHWAGQR